MTLEQLRVFVEVAERLHMTRAAEALNITQSAASAGIAALETRHGVRLFDRIGRGLKLTEAGRVFLPEARAVLGRATAAALALDDLAGLKRGAIALAASQTVANYWLPSRMAAFAKSHPDVALKLTVGNTAQVAEAVLDGGADLGFIEGDVDSPLLERTRVSTDRIAIYVAPSHPLADAVVGPRDLEGLLWARREVGSGTRSEFEHALVELGVDTARLRTALELTSNEAVLEAAASGGLGAAVSELAARSFVAAGRLTRLRFDLPDRHFDMVTRRERSRSPAVAAFVVQV
jgi:DNA-binding transcriptional LysR family regulator